MGPMAESDAGFQHAGLVLVAAASFSHDWFATLVAGAQVMLGDRTPSVPTTTPVAFWCENGHLWIEFTDGHLQGFRTSQGQKPGQHESPPQ